MKYSLSHRRDALRRRQSSREREHGGNRWGGTHHSKAPAGSNEPQKSFGRFGHVEALSQPRPLRSRKGMSHAIFQQVLANNFGVSLLLSASDTYVPGHGERQAGRQTGRQAGRLRARMKHKTRNLDAQNDVGVSKSCVQSCLTNSVLIFGVSSHTAQTP